MVGYLVITQFGQVAALIEEGGDPDFGALVSGLPIAGGILAVGFLLVVAASLGRAFSKPRR